MNKLILFDWGNVLLDSDSNVYNIFDARKDIALELNLQNIQKFMVMFDKEDFWTMNGNYLNALIQQHLMESGCHCTVDDFKQCYLKHYSKVQWFSDMVSLINRHNVIIIEVTKDMYNCKSLRLAIELLAKCTKELPYDHLFLVTDSYLPELVKIESCFGLRIITRVDEMLSNTFLGCNLASLEKEKYGFAWVTERDNFYVKRRLLIPFKPITYFAKVCKYLSTGINNSYDAYRAEWEHYCKNDEDDDFFLLWKDANQWNVTPVDDSEEYNKMIKDYSHVQLCEEILKGMNEYAWFTRETEENSNKV